MKLTLAKNVDGIINPIIVWVATITMGTLMTWKASAVTVKTPPMKMGATTVYGIWRCETMIEEKCSNCRNRENRPMTYRDWCPVINEWVAPYDDIYSLCCDCWEEDI